MSTVKTNNAQIGQSATATNNFTWYQPASPDGTVRLGVGNSGATSADVMTLNSSGNVGIGTSSPDAKLTVSYTAAAGDIVTLKGANGVNGALGVHAGINGGVYLQAAATRDLRLRIGSTDHVYLDTSGNLGLGVTPYTLSGLSNAVTFDMKSGPGILGYADNAYFSSNAYYNSNWLLKSATGAMQLQFQSASQTFYMYGAASGSAGGAANWVNILGGAKDKTIFLQGASPATGTGITFPATQSASSDANTLDDYEEGTFDCGISGAGGPTITSQYNTYTKIGRVVTLNIRVNIRQGSATGGQNILGLPFTSRNTTNYKAVGAGFWSGAATAITSSFCTLPNNTTTLFIYRTTAATTSPSTWQGADWQAGADTEMSFSITYITD